MKATTVFVAIGWIVIGAITLAAALLNLSLWGREMLASSLLASSWGTAGFVGGIGLWARRAFGWWIVFVLNLAATAFFGYAYARWLGEWWRIGGYAFEVDNGLQFLVPVFAAAFAVGVVALILNRPSTWHADIELKSDS